MKGQRLMGCLTVLNAMLLMGLVARERPAVAAEPAGLPVLRGRGLEIVDDQGRVRARISVHAAEKVNGKQYPGAVVLQMGEPNGPPGVKLSASSDGAGLGLSTSQRVGDGRPVGIELHADDPVVILRDAKGHERVVKP